MWPVAVVRRSSARKLLPRWRMPYGRSWLATVGQGLPSRIGMFRYVVALGQRQPLRRAPRRGKGRPVGIAFAWVPMWKRWLRVAMGGRRTPTRTFLRP